MYFFFRLALLKVIVLSRLLGNGKLFKVTSTSFTSFTVCFGDI